MAARAARPTAETLGEVDEDVAADRFERLRAWRRVAASKAGIPPYMIFHDKALWVMARTAITSTAELLTVPGVGRATAEKYSSELLAILADE